MKRITWLMPWKKIHEKKKLDKKNNKRKIIKEKYKKNGGLFVVPTQIFVYNYKKIYHISSTLILL